jgi:hypothetical protein
MIRVSALENLSPSQSTQHRIFLAASAVLLMMLLSTPAWADTVNFADTTDTVVGTTPDNTGRASIGPVCGFGTFAVPLSGGSIFANVEGCTATINAPTGFPNGGAALTLYLVTENGVVSDLLAVAVPGNGTAELLFVSDPSVNGTEPGLSSSVVNTLCTAFTCASEPEAASVSITWKNANNVVGATDTVSFQSDAEGVVPEPASLALLGSGLMAIAGFIKRRLP